MPFLIFLAFVLIFIFFHFTNEKIEYYETRSKSKQLSVIVAEYRKERVSIRNDFTELEYPYVRIDLDDGEFILRKLSHANSFGKSFKIGQRIDVFWYGSDLLLWNAYDNGLYKYLPNKWNFFS